MVGNLFECVPPRVVRPHLLVRNPETAHPPARRWRACATAASLLRGVEKRPVAVLQRSREILFNQVLVQWDDAGFTVLHRQLRACGARSIALNYIDARSCVISPTRAPLYAQAKGPSAAPSSGVVALQAPNAALVSLVVLRERTPVLA
jgi:hypothetical protein